jgi:hypothetical protein
MPDVPVDEAASLLDHAEDIVNAAGPEIVAEVRKEDELQGRTGRHWWNRKR